MNKPFQDLNKGDRFTFKGQRFEVIFTEKGTPKSWLNQWVLTAINLKTRMGTEFFVKHTASV